MLAATLSSRISALFLSLFSASTKRSYNQLNIRAENPAFTQSIKQSQKLECEPMPNAMAAPPNIGGALCSMPQSLADAHYYSAVQ